MIIGFWCAGFALGWGPIPWLIMSEIFPVKVRGFASAVCVLTNWSMAFLITKTFQNMMVSHHEEAQRSKIYQNKNLHHQSGNDVMHVMTTIMTLNVCSAGFSDKRWDLLALFLDVLHQRCLHHSLCPRD